MRSGDAMSDKRLRTDESGTVCTRQQAVENALLFPWQSDFSVV